MQFCLLYILEQHLERHFILLYSFRWQKTLTSSNVDISTSYNPNWVGCSASVCGRMDILSEIFGPEGGKNERSIRPYLKKFRYLLNGWSVLSNPRYCGERNSTCSTSDNSPSGVVELNFFSWLYRETRSNLAALSTKNWKNIFRNTSIIYQLKKLFDV